MAEHKRVPVKLGDFSVMDSEFNNIRERFDSEMKKMEDEMNKFRDDVIEKEANFFTKSSQESRTSSSSFRRDGRLLSDEKSTFRSSSSSSSDNMLMGSGLGNHSNWLRGHDSPLIRDSESVGGRKELKLRFDVSQYSPEEIMVKTVDNKLLVQAKHEESGDGKSVFREYNREFLLPSGTDPETIKSSLSKDGILTVEAPLPQPAIENQGISSKK